MQTKRVVTAFFVTVAFALPCLAAPRPLAEPPMPGAAPGASLNPEPTTQAVSPVVMSRGRLLYENHCTACHESVLHVREAKRARTLPELRAWVVKWSVYQKLRWRKEEIEDVVNDLNTRFYKIDAR